MFSPISDMVDSEPSATTFSRHILDPKQANSSGSLVAYAYVSLQPAVAEFNGIFRSRETLAKLVTPRAPSTGSGCNPER